MEVQIDKMYRAIHLSSMAYNATYPNPRVGAVLVHKGEVIGEGYHHRYGDAHAEEQCIKSVQPEHQHLIADSTLYLTLEPCNHQGKRPACTSLILSHKIKKLVVATLDPNPVVNGTGVQKLRSEGVEVITGVLEEEAISQNSYFHHYHTQQKPYVILKWAQDAEGNMGRNDARIKISAALTNTFTMRWRAETQSILIGAQTAITDNPQLTNRSGLGVQPIRYVVDPKLRARKHKPPLALSEQAPATVFLHSDAKSPDEGYISNTATAEISTDQILQKLYERDILVVLVEGGARTLEHFIQQDNYDEIRVIKSKHTSSADIPAPKVPVHLDASEEIESADDIISYYYS